MFRVRHGFLSVTGNYRENNEDRCLVDGQGRYFIVADGMGGQAAGEKASELATELVPQKLERLIDFENSPPEEVVKSIDEAVSYANAEIIALGEVDPDYHNMGTTITYVVRVGNRLFIGNAGDSRVYLYRNGRLTQLTVDHSLTQALLDAGTISREDAATHRYRNVLYKYLGTKEGSTGTEPRQIEPEVGDRFVLCSDGVTDGMGDDSMRELLEAYSDPQAAAEAIVEAALAGGSKDNITCVVLNIEPAE